MYCLQVRFPNGQELLRRSFEQPPAGGLYIRQSFGLRPGDPVCLQIELPCLVQPCFLNGVVARCGVPLKEGGRTRHFTEIRFAAEEATHREALLESARRDLEVLRLRKTKRCTVQVDLRVDPGGDGPAFEGLTADLGPGGAFIPSAEVLPVGTRVNLSFFLPGYATNLCATGEVVHHGYADRKGQPGLGIRFAPQGAGEQRELRGLYRYAARQAG